MTAARTKKPRHVDGAGHGLPGISDVASLFDDPEMIADFAASAGERWRGARARLGDRGTRAHAAIAWVLRKGFASGDSPPQLEAGDAHAFHCWTGIWMARYGLRPGVEVLRVEENLVDEVAGVGGTPDAVIREGSDVAVYDWKTSKTVRPAHIVQIAAYMRALERDAGITCTRGIVMRLPTSHADAPHEVTVPMGGSVYTTALDGFDAALRVFRARSEIASGLRTM